MVDLHPAGRNLPCDPGPGVLRPRLNAVDGESIRVPHVGRTYPGDGRGGDQAIAEVPIYRPLLDAELAHLNAFEGDDRQIKGIKNAYGGRHGLHRLSVRRVGSDLVPGQR